MKYRNLRVGNLIRDELGKIILKEMEFPDALVTITDVEIGEDMDWAKVMISVIPPAKAENALKSLRLNRGRLQHMLLRKINIKPMPKIGFEIDRGVENAARVEKLLIEDNNK